MNAGYDSIEDYERDIYGLDSDSEQEESNQEIEQELYQQIHYGQEGSTSHCEDADDRKNGYTREDLSSDGYNGSGRFQESSKDGAGGSEPNSDVEDCSNVEDSVVLLKVVNTGSKKRKKDFACISLLSSDSCGSSDSSTSLPAKKLKSVKQSINQSNVRTTDSTFEFNQSNRSKLQINKPAMPSVSSDNQSVIVLLSSSSESETEWTIIDEVDDSSDEVLQTNLIGGSVRNECVNADSGELWNIHPEDIVNDVRNCEGKFRIFSKPKRYYSSKTSIRCYNCGNSGHLSKSCPCPRKLIVCYLCAGRGHTGWKCPNQICSVCNKTGHPFKYCSMKPWHKASEVCTRCQIKGHSSKECPDRWRQFHVTTEAGVIAKLTVEKMARKLYCYNCAKRGHLGHECTRPRMDRMTIPATPFICRYDSWKDVENRFEQVRRNLKYQEQENHNRLGNNHVYFTEADTDWNQGAMKRKRDPENDWNQPGKKIKRDHDNDTYDSKFGNETKKKKKKRDINKSSKKVTKTVKKTPKDKVKGQIKKKPKKKKLSKQRQNNDKKAKSSNYPQTSHVSNKQKSVQRKTAAKCVPPKSIHIKIQNAHDNGNQQRNVTWQNGANNFPRTKLSQKKVYSECKSEFQIYKTTTNQQKKVTAKRNNNHDQGSNWNPQYGRSRGGKGYVSKRGFYKGSNLVDVTLRGVL